MPPNALIDSLKSQLVMFSLETLKEGTVGRGENYVKRNCNADNNKKPNDYG